ncbi:MAG TPA: cytochrome c-type biogenesis protein [Micropepsaceae bacterium]|nr:cytochrome c-type biogenesis protein [Micropepsaceae bacterium]
MKALATLFASLLIALAIGTSAPAAAQQPDESTYVPPLSDPVLEARAKALQRELRCLVCQGQSIDESNSALAADLRRLIRQQMQQGLSDDDIKNFLVARYGAFVLMKPPVRQDTFFLWFGPGLLVLVGGAVVGVTVLRARRRLATDTGADLEMPSGGVT